MQHRHEERWGEEILFNQPLSNKNKEIFPNKRGIDPQKNKSSSPFAEIYTSIL